MHFHATSILTPTAIAGDRARAARMATRLPGASAALTAMSDPDPALLIHIAAHGLEPVHVTKIGAGSF